MIVVAGESLIDLVPQHPGDPLGPLSPRPGGGPYNTAVALGRLGARVAFCSRVSTDGFGEALLGGLAAAGVDTSLVQRGPEPTTLTVAAVGLDGSAGYGFYADGTADRLFELPPQLPPQATALSLGTCSLVLEPGASAYEALLRRESGRGLLTLLDPNIRPPLIPDADAYRARFRSWLPYVSLLKLSEEDAAWLGGTVEEWLEMGPRAVVVTRGAAGLSVHTAQGATYAVPAERVEIVDTIGAGDTVNAALLRHVPTASALPAADWPRVLRYAARAGALTCARRGAQPPTAEEVRAAFSSGPAQFPAHP
ncbi:carbohydrate kinase [Streptomyces sp. NPDC048361]|uniref:carbohydrate kinase family protein n=1 Tax=Streptomyces sp. NPDC048361 TaxID=3154720 RepID=UPI00341C459B